MSIWAKTSLSGVYSVPSQNALLWNDRSWRAERAFGRRRRQSAMGDPGAAAFADRLSGLQHRVSRINKPAS
jgi:hypothetical protein